MLQQLRTRLCASIFTVVFTTATVLLIMYLTDFVTDGASYVVVSTHGLLFGQPRRERDRLLLFNGANDTITAGVTDKMVWQFNVKATDIT